MKRIALLTLMVVGCGLAFASSGDGGAKEKATDFEIVHDVGVDMVVSVEPFEMCGACEDMVLIADESASVVRFEGKEFTEYMIDHTGLTEFTDSDLTALEDSGGDILKPDLLNYYKYKHSWSAIKPNSNDYTTTFVLPNTKTASEHAVIRCAEIPTSVVTMKIPCFLRC